MATAPAIHESLWVATSQEAGFGSLEESIDVDVAVIGAGITGLTTALLLKNDGLRVAVLDLSGVGLGATGYTTAKVSAQHGVMYHTVRSKFGDEGARRYAEANTAGLDLVERLVGEHRIDCDFERRPFFAYTEQDALVGEIEEEVAAAREAGMPASYTQETELPWPVKAALRVEDQGQFHPRRYCLGLARAIDGDGSRVCERTRVLDVDEGSFCVVKTERHHVRAAFVVLATQLPFLDRGAFFAKAHPERSYAMALTLEQPVPRGMYISVEEPTRSVRQCPVDGGEVMILEGESHKPGEDDDENRHYAALEGFAAERFAVRSYDYRWSTQDYMPVDRVPYIGRLRRGSKRIYVGTGYQKWGLTSGSAAGILIRDQILGRDNPWSELFDPNRIKPGASAKEFVKENLFVARRFFQDRITKRAPAAPEDLALGEGRVMSVRGRQIAVSRDEGGMLHAVSARCTHLGCIVNWNSAERTWDCPCHGSRFSPSGEVIQAPAVDALKPASPDGS